MPLLLYAIEKGQKEIVELLLNHGADVTMTDGMKNSIRIYFDF